MNDELLTPSNYLEDIGLWPAGEKVGRAYVTGFVLSLVLTLLAFAFVMGGAPATTLSIGILMLLAVGQFFVQVIHFLHLGSGLKDRSRLIVLLSFCIIVAILLVGSLWVMFTLNARMMPSADQMMQYMQSQDAM